MAVCSSGLTKGHTDRSQTPPSDTLNEAPGIWNRAIWYLEFALECLGETECEAELRQQIGTLFIKWPQYLVASQKWVNLRAV